VTQFNCLQQTGNFCPSASNGPTATSSGTGSSPTMSAESAPSPTMSVHISAGQAATDAFFALVGTQEADLGSLGALVLPALTG
jgi:hypothetical protein